ncbi:MAG: hypothetical protein NVSMB3_12680 [Acidobacteriaceae bacterium]
MALHTTFLTHVGGTAMANPKILLVDDDEILRFTLDTILAKHGFDVTSVGNPPDALKMIASQSFDVLLTDLHMPGAGDGLTVVSAMRHANPRAVTLLLSAFPEMKAAAHAILMQADEILVKPIQVETLIDLIRQRMAAGPLHSRVVESVATILERATESTIEDWFEEVGHQRELMSVPLSHGQRCEHLPQVFRDLIVRLRSHKELGTKDLMSAAAAEHGAKRRRQGYTAAMMVEESRMLQVSIFRTLQKNLMTIDFSVLLLGVMTIADEVDSQLSQAMQSYILASTVDALPA